LRAKQRVKTKKTWKEVMDKGMKNLHLKPNEAVILRGNWDDSNSDSNDMG